MAIISFKKQFAPLIESGKKRQTIREVGKRSYKVGDTLYAYTGLRTKVCRKIGEFKIKSIDKLNFSSEYIYYNDLPLIGWEREQLAKDDGFKNYEEFMAWFRNQYGVYIFKTDFQIIRW